MSSSDFNGEMGQSNVIFPEEGYNHKNLTFYEILENFRKSFELIKKKEAKRREASKGEWRTT